MKSFRHIFFLVIMLGYQLSLGQALAFSKNARTFEAQSGSLLVKSLAFSCLGLKRVQDDLPCNPAMVPEATSNELKVFVLISNGYANLNKVKSLLAGDFNQSLINELFSENRVLQTEASGDLLFSSRYLNAKVSPLSYNFFSVVRNDANPDVEMVGVEKQEVTLQTGFAFNRLRFGLEMKSSQWKFIRQNFKLLSISTPAGADILKPKTQSTLFFSPSVSYIFDFWGAPSITVMQKNLGQQDPEFTEFQHPKGLQIGLALNPPIFAGDLSLLLDYKSLSADDSEQEKIHLGALYKYGVMNLASGIDNHGASLGVFYTIENLNSGIMFSTTQLPWKERDYYSQTVYVQVGWKL